MREGKSLGVIEGKTLGLGVGLSVGARDGFGVIRDGRSDGTIDGNLVGA